MKKFKYILFSFVSAGLILFTGCKDDYLNTVPTASLSDVTVYSSLENLELILNGVYRHMVSQDGSSQGLGGEPGYIVSRETLGDDLTWQTNTWHQTTHQWVAHRTATNSVTTYPWRYYYRWNMHANLVLENIDPLESQNPVLHHGLKGEALCFRAYTHFLLVQMYAKRYEAGAANEQLGVPVRTNSSFEPQARNTVAEVYKQINEDLDLAIQLLEGYSPKNRQTHFTQEVAYGLKARVALAQQDYAKAADAATKGLDLAKKQGYALMQGDDLLNGFADVTTATKEAMWASMPNSDQTIYFYHFMAYMSWNDNTTAIRQGVKSISLDTYEKVQPTDVRRKWWDPEGTRNDLTAPAYDAYTAYPGQVRKFRARSQADHVSDYAYMRIAEFYLVKAEALARQGKDAEAQAALTEFAITRDPEYKASNAGAALVEEIMTQRRIELWGEGFRFFDLKRLNLPLDRKGSNFKQAFCRVLQVAAGAPEWQFAIPQEELDTNELMKVNE
ncbi:membrane protein [Bacteroidia bacterium]|nr:membrane protein [Bacteroidia bacterium]